jgi:hypothetical protein
LGSVPKPSRIDALVGARYTCPGLVGIVPFLVLLLWRPLSEAGLLRLALVVAGLQTRSFDFMPSKTIDRLIINSSYSEPAEHRRYNRESRLFSLSS